MNPINLVVILTFISLAGTVSLDDEVDKSGWVDPHDMGIPGKPIKPRRHDPEKPLSLSDILSQASKDRTEPKLPPGSMLNKFEQVSNCAETERDLLKCQQSLKQSDVNKENVNPPSCSPATDEVIFLRRHVKYLLNKLGNVVDETEFVGDFQLSRIDMHLLKSFADNPESVAISEISHILDGVFVDIKRKSDLVEEDQFVPNFDDYSSLVLHYLPSSQDWFWFFIFGGTFFLIYSFLIGVAIWKIFVTTVIVSSAWHWTHMYKVAMAKKHATLVRSQNVPVECFPKNMTWSHFIFDTVFSSSKEKCAQYHEASMVDPFLEVSPTMAVAETLTKFVLLPLEHLGKNIGRFFGALLSELTWVSSPLILAFVFVAILLILIMVFGYRFRLPPRHEIILYR